MTRHVWTAEEQERLWDLYPDRFAHEVAALMGLTKQQIFAQAHRLKIRKSAAFLEREREHNRQVALNHAGMVTNRFPKGLVPWNKGLKYKAGGRSPDTRFKKGQWPANKDRDFYVIGALRLNADGYLDVRTSFDIGARGWTGLHRLVWQQHHGQIPKGFMVTFKDGDRDNCVIENLKLITYAENARRNYIDKYPIEVRRLVTMKALITRHVRRIERENNEPDNYGRSAHRAARNAQRLAQQRQPNGT